MVNKKIRRNIIGIAIACLFIVNPNINIIDILPDFIGYIILSLCVARLADLNELLDEARIAFTRMIWIDLAKIIAIFWTFGMSVTGEYTSSLMLWSFVFGVLEIIFAVPAFSKMFAGLIQLGNHYPNEIILKRRNKPFSDKQRAKNETERLRSFTTFFVSLKAVLAFLPEFADMSNTAYDESLSGTVNLYQFIGLLRFLAFIPVLVIGIIWIVRLGIYFVNLSKDKEFVDSFSNVYESKVLCKKGIFIKRRIQLSFFMLVLASALTIDFRITVDSSLNKVNFIPDIIPAILFLIFFVAIKKYSGKKVGYNLFVGIIYIFASILSYASELYFFTNFSYSAIIRSDAALFSFVVMIALEALSGVALILVMLGVYNSLCGVIVRHTGYVLGRENVTEATERQAAELQRELKRPLGFVIATALIYVVSDIAYELLIDSVGFMGVINIVCAAAFIISVVKAQSEILLAVNTKYMLE